MREIEFARLVLAEPRLLTLAEAAAAVDSSDEHFCANDVWAEHFKPELVKLVGWYAEGTNPVLHTTAAYDTAYDICYEALPDCRDCGCPSLPIMVNS